MKNKASSFIILFAFLTGLWSCNPSIDNPLPDRPKPLGKGIYILNYGLNSGEGGSLDFFSLDSNRMNRNIFESRNGTEAGKGLSGMMMWKQYAFFTAEKSSAVWVINASTALFAGRYNRLLNPRKLFVIDAEKTYLSSSTQKGIHVMHTASMQNIGTVSIPARIEHFALSSGKVFASPAFAQSASGRKIYVVDYLLDALVDSIPLPGHPSWLEAASDGLLWVLCSGSEAGHSALLAFDSHTLELTRQHALPSFDYQQSGIAFAGSDMMVILAGDVYTYNTGLTGSVPQLLISASGRQFTSLLVDSASNILYLTGIRNGLSDGHLFRFSNSSTLLDSVPTGIRPVASAFN